MDLLILLIIMAIVVLGPSAVIGVLGYATIKALGRNPWAASKIFMGTVFLLIFVEGLAIVSMLLIFQLFAGG